MNPVAWSASRSAIAAVLLAAALPITARAQNYNLDGPRQIVPEAQGKPSEPAAPPITSSSGGKVLIPELKGVVMIDDINQLITGGA